MKNQRDENGNRQGLWEEYYSSGKLWYKVIYKNGAAHGPWECYYSSGELRWKGAYKRDNRVGLWYSSTR